MQPRQDQKRPRRNPIRSPSTPHPSNPSTLPEDTPSVSGSRSTQLSNRSRAGCWTCRGRKVKCDEVRPRCGPCTRLERECDWEQRWNFSDVTSSTQDRHANVQTAGNHVWDPDARSSVTMDDVNDAAYDDLPDLAALVTDEDRERKAVTRRPGTYRVVVTPESIAELPEYAPGPSRMRVSTQQPRDGRDTSPLLSRAVTRVESNDPNVVVVERFQTAVAPPTTPQDHTTPTSLDFNALDLSTPTLAASVPANVDSSQSFVPEHQLLEHFHRHLAHRYTRHYLEPVDSAQEAKWTAERLEAGAMHFTPLRHAMCALSALNLSFHHGRSSLEQATQHYSQSLDARALGDIPADAMASDGNFFRHFLLFVYDTCMPVMPRRQNDIDMRATNLDALDRIALARTTVAAASSSTSSSSSSSSDRGPGGPGASAGTGMGTDIVYALWMACELDVSACLMGIGDGQFMQKMLWHGILPPLPPQPPRPRQLPQQRGTPPIYRDADHDALHAAAQQLHRHILLHAGTIARTARAWRGEDDEAATRARRAVALPSSVVVRRRAHVEQLERELHTIWRRAWPAHMDLLSREVRAALEPRVLYALEDAFTLYHALILYVYTSMYVGQQRYQAQQPAPPPPPPQPRRRTTTTMDVDADADDHCDGGHHIVAILDCAEAALAYQAAHQRVPPPASSQHHSTASTDPSGSPLHSPRTMSPAAAEAGSGAATESTTGTTSPSPAPVQLRRYARRRLAFPLFMAGTATRSRGVARRAAGLLWQTEQTAIGPNVRRTWRVLVKVWARKGGGRGLEEEEESGEEEQWEGSGGEEEDGDVEWMEVARELGLMVANCGL